MVSCNISAVFSDLLGIESRSTPLLLVINSFTASIVIIGIIVLLSKRQDNISDSYPWKHIVPLCTVMALNCLLGLRFSKYSADIIRQCISGGVIFAGALVLLLNLFRRQSINNNREKTQYFIAVIGDEDFKVEKYVLEEMPVINKDIAVIRFISIDAER